jgi:hypothetical protein
MSRNVAASVRRRLRNLAKQRAEDFHILVRPMGDRGIVAAISG